MSKRDMTIGVTINLQNYESLRIEVEDEVETEEDVRKLATFLDESLALFGSDDPATRRAVEHYRKRVLGGAIGGEAGAAATAVAEPKATTPRAAAPPAPETEAAGPVTPEPAATEGPEETPAPKPADRSAAKSAPKAPAKAAAPSPSGAVCESCGVPVTAAEEKTSRLFVSKTLCKKCIQSL